MNVRPLQFASLPNNDIFHIQPIFGAGGKSLQHNEVFRRASAQQHMRREGEQAGSGCHALFERQDTQGNIHPCPSQRACSSAAARMTSVTASRFHEPSLLLNEARSWLRRPRRHSVIGWSTEECDGAPGIHLAQFVASQALQILASFLPGVNPAPAEGDLFRRPPRETRQGKRFIFYECAKNSRLALAGIARWVVEQPGRRRSTTSRFLCQMFNRRDPQTPINSRRFYRVIPWP